MRYFNIGYGSANYYLIDAGQHCLAVDVGWPGTINDYGRRLRPTGRKVQEVDYLIVTHFHVDHAGLVQELKNLGVRFVLLDVQVKHIAQMENFVQRKMSYDPINLKDSTIITVAESRRFLNGIGIAGEVLHTPGHTDDSISVILDSGDAFVGDLRPENQLAEDDAASRSSWVKLRALGARRVNPRHGNAFELLQS